MKFIDIVLTLIDKKGTTKNKVAMDLGLGKNSFVDWAKNDNIPNGDIVLKIATYFNVSTDYLLTGNEPQAQPHTAILPHLEKLYAVISLLSRDECIELTGELKERTKGRSAPQEKVG